MWLFSRSVGSDSVMDPECRAIFQGSFRHMHGSVGSNEGVLVSTIQWIRRKALESQGVTGPGMSRSHPRLSGHEFESTPGVGDGQGGLACCNSWGRKESHTTERLN